MKTLIRNISIYTFILFLLPQIIPGVHIIQGLSIFFVGGVVLTLLFLVLRPILSIISFPVNMITLGVFNIFINALLIYLLTVFVTEISITAFTYERTNLFGIILPSMSFNTFFAYIYTAFVLTMINGFIKWLMD